MVLMFPCHYITKTKTNIKTKTTQAATSRYPKLCLLVGAIVQSVISSPRGPQPGGSFHPQGMRGIYCLSGQISIANNANGHKDIHDWNGQKCWIRMKVGCKILTKASVWKGRKRLAAVTDKLSATLRQCDAILATNKNRNFLWQCISAGKSWQRRKNWSSCNKVGCTKAL